MNKWEPTAPILMDNLMDNILMDRNKTQKAKGKQEKYVC